MKKRFLTLITRCRDEPFFDEFLEHYFNEGVDFVYVIDDNRNMNFSQEVLENRGVEVVKAKHWTENGNHPLKGQMADVNVLFERIRSSSEWFVHVDCDEFITTRRNPDLSIRDELLATFQNTSCVKVPWVMMASNQRERDPESLLEELIYRWDHDLRHPHPDGWRKGRCRYEEIEVKSIFRGEEVDCLKPHYPKIKSSAAGFRVVNGVDATPSPLDPFFPNLRNRDIEQAWMVCYHYRIASRESARRKVESSGKLRGAGGYPNLETIMAADYAEIRDETLKLKCRLRRKEGRRTGLGDRGNDVPGTHALVDELPAPEPLPASRVGETSPQSRPASTGRPRVS